MKNSTAIIIILVACGLFYTFIAPEYSKVQALRANLIEYENIIQNVSSLAKQRDDLLIKYNAVPSADVSHLTKALPDYIDTVRLAMDFDNISAKYGISIKSFQVVDNKNTSIADAVSNKSYNATTVSFSFVTSYPSFRKFMRDIEQSLRIIDVKNVSFSASDNGLNEYNVSIQTYWLK
ncbi:MAG: type 4a pilus biogenesis protein PilO [Minisyncoccia bacterium]